jgi:hypothetical protein
MSTEAAQPSDFPYTHPQDVAREFASRGIFVLAPEQLGISPDVHARIFQHEKELVDAGQPVMPGGLPDVLEVINAPGVVAVCNQLLGEHWAIVPFTHNASFTSGGRDQHWHKDDNGPYNGKKQRHHQAVQIEMLYYPQDVTPEMGPTATIPYSHYLSFDSEENQDNFAGAEHLDFNYQLSRMESEPVSGPDSKYSREEIVERRTAHDIRMREAVEHTGWPLVSTLEAAPLRAGSVVFYSHNTFHRGNHRRDDWNTWKDNPRFMWRFWLYRTSEPNASAPAEINWNSLGVDPLSQADLTTASDDVTTVWRYHYHWLHTGQAPAPRPDAAALDAAARESEAKALYAQLQSMGEANEAVRMGAAYKLASLGDETLAVKTLEQGLYSGRESVRRAATHGLIAVGPASTACFLRAAASPAKWVRKAGIHGLGDAAEFSGDVLSAVASVLQSDSSVHVRSVAAGTIGCLGRRAAGTGTGIEHIPACAEALTASLGREENRLAMDRAQGRSIKYVRPTDECDICEGGGVDYGQARFAPVRSAVRENALWSLVILSSQGPALLGQALPSTIDALEEVVRSDQNVICVGFAMDALTRLAHINAQDDPAATALRARLRDVLGLSPMRAWEALVRGGLNAQDAAEFEAAAQA